MTPKLVEESRMSHTGILVLGRNPDPVWCIKLEGGGEIPVEALYRDFRNTVVKIEVTGYRVEAEED